MVSYYNSISGQKNFHYPPIWDKFILISDKWNSKSTCPIGQVEFTRRNFSLSSQLPKDFYTNLFSTNFCFFLIKKLASFWHSFIEDMVPTFYIIWKANNGDNVISFMATSGKNSKCLNCITSTIFNFLDKRIPLLNNQILSGTCPMDKWKKEKSFFALNIVYFACVIHYA